MHPEGNDLRDGVGMFSYGGGLLSVGRSAGTAEGNASFQRIYGGVGRSYDIYNFRMGSWLSSLAMCRCNLRTLVA